MKNEQKEIKIGIVLSYLTQAVQIIVGLIYTPIMISLLGQSEYGVYQLVYSTVSNLNLLGLGLGSSYAHFYFIEKKKGGKDYVSKLNAMYLIVYLIMCFTCLVLGMVMVKNIHVLFGSGLNGNEYSIARILMSLLVINIAITFPSNIFDSWIQVHERFVFIKTLILLQNVLNPVVTLPLLLMGYGSIGKVFATTVISILIIILEIIYSIFKLSICFSFHNLDFRILKSVGGFTFFIFLNQIIDQINWSVDKFLLGRMKGAITVAIYGVASQLNNMYIQFSVSISNLFIPKINRLVVENDKHGISNLFIEIGRIQCIVISLILGCFCFFGSEFINLWVGEQYSSSFITALYLFVGGYVELIQNSGTEILRAYNKHQIRSIVYLSISVSNVLISIPLIKAFNAPGAAFGTMITMIIGNGIFMNWYYDRKIGLDIKSFWFQITRIALPIISAILVSAIVKHFLPATSFISLIFNVLIFTVVYLIVAYKCFMNKYEKALIHDRVLDKFHR